MAVEGVRRRGAGRRGWRTEGRVEGRVGKAGRRRGNLGGGEGEVGGNGRVCVVGRLSESPVVVLS